MPSIEKGPDFELDEQALEASLPTLTEKLRQLEAGLGDEEKAVLSSIVNSAALHLEQMEAISATAEIRYAKPISAVATANVRSALLRLPTELGLDQ